MSLLRALGLLGVAYLGLLLCSVLPAVLPGRLPVPDVALIVALYAGLTCRLVGGASMSLRDGRPAAMAAFGLALGYLADLVSGAPRGLHALGLCLLLLLLRSAATQLLVRGAGFVMAVSALTAVLFGLLLGALRVWAEPDTSFGGLRVVVSQAAVTALCAPVVFHLLQRIDARLWREGRPRGLSL